MNEVTDDGVKEEKELLRIKKKYSIKYVLIVKLIEVYIIFLLVILFSFFSNRIGIGIFSIFLLVVFVIVYLILSKKSASKTYMIFYDTKVVYKRKFLSFEKERALEYSEIKDIVYTQGTSWYTRFWQKIFGFGNIYVYPKKGNIFTHGMSIDVIENIDKVVDELKNLIGDKIK